VEELVYATENFEGYNFESPQYVRTSIAAAMTMGIVPGKFFRNAKLHCLNLLLNYNEGCVGKCAYCGLSRTRETGKEWKEQSFIRVDWPVVSLDKVIRSLDSGFCAHVERVCISMITNGAARKDTLTVVERLREKTDRISSLITPTIIDKDWLYKLKSAGADMVGVAIDAATPELFEKLRGSGVGGPHRWQKYWKTVEEAVDVFGRFNVGVHLIVGLGEKEKDMVEAIQRAQNKGSKTHLFSFFPEEKSLMQDSPQPPIGKYRRIQLASYLVNSEVAGLEEMVFDEDGQLRNYGVDKETLDQVIESGRPFMTSGCRGKTLENACNRPFANCTPYQACFGGLRNYPFQPNKQDIELIGKQIWNYENANSRV
jgi:biotin synthase